MDNNMTAGPHDPYQTGPMPPAQPAGEPTFGYGKTINPVGQATMPQDISPPPSISNGDHHQMVPQPQQPQADPPSSDQPSSMNNVSLDNAYIATDPAGTTPAASNDPPSAASLVTSKDPQDDLMHMKQQALHSLSPLINKLDQSPEEKFKTTMQMIQASDNPQLIKEAYDAANQISDEKTKAQALLDIVNEINYFTHSSSNPEPAAS